MGDFGDPGGGPRGDRGRRGAGSGSGDPATGVVRITPRDVFGSPLGPGRGDGLIVGGTSGTTVTGPLAAEWPAGTSPGVVVGQPGRDPVCLCPENERPPSKPGPRPKWCPPWLWALVPVGLAVWWKIVRHHGRVHVASAGTRSVSAWLSVRAQPPRRPPPPP